MRSEVLVIAIGLVASALCQLPEKWVNQYPEWPRWLRTRLCIEKEYNERYHKDACLDGPLDGTLRMDSNLIGPLENRTVQYTETPDSGIWTAILDTGVEGHRVDFSPGTPLEYTLVIYNGRNECLTWQKYPRDAVTLENVTNGLGRVFNDNSTSFWLGDVHLKRCSYLNAYVDVFGDESFPHDFSKLADNQKFWVKVEGAEQGSSQGDAPVKRRIIPKIVGDDRKPIDFCNGNFGIFDRMETGKEPVYSIAVGENRNKTTIGWGCTNQIWSLKWPEKEYTGAKAITIGVGGIYPSD
ncbi:hypothetical protein TWF281_010976 [Arthrobotrys megalospora]